MTETKTIPCPTWLDQQAPYIDRIQGLFSVTSDPTKLKIILLLDQYNKHSDEHDETMYVSDLAKHIGVSVSAISHQLRLLESNLFVTKKKCGQTVCYRLTDQADALLEAYSKLTV